MINYHSGKREAVSSTGITANIVHVPILLRFLHVLSLACNFLSKDSSLSLFDAIEALVYLKGEWPTIDYPCLCVTKTFITKKVPSHLEINFSLLEQNQNTVHVHHTCTCTGCIITQLGTVAFQAELQNKHQ